MEPRPSVRGRLPTLAEAAIAAGLIGTPLALGGVPLWASDAMAVLALAAAVSALFAHTRRVSRFVWVGFAVAGLAALQAVPLPYPLRHLLSPKGSELVSALIGAQNAGAISLDPAATSLELVRLGGYALLFFASARLSCDGVVARRLALYVALATGIQCALVAAHKVVDAHAVYGVVPLTITGHVLGSFGNLNHLAGYLTLGAPIAGVLSLDSRTPRARWGFGLVAVSACAILLATFSRSGLAGLLTAGLAFHFLVVKRHRSETPWWWPAAAAAAAAVVLAGLVALTGRGAKLTSIAHPLALLTEEKVMVWRDLPGLVGDYWRAGVGRGAFEEVFFQYKRHADTMAFSHVECAPLQVLVDFGVPAGTLILISWLLGLLRAAWSKPLIARAAAAALLGITIHDLGDFSLDGAPAVAATAAVLWGVALGVERGSSEPRSVRRRSRLVRGAVLLGLVCAMTAGFVYGHRADLRRDVAQVTAAEREGAPLDTLLAAVMERHPVEPWFHLISGIDRIRHHDAARALHQLNAALTLDPAAWRPHLATGEALLQLGRVSQAILEYRLAYRTSGYRDDVVVAMVTHASLRAPGALTTFGAGDPALLDHLADVLERLHLLVEADRAAANAADLAPNDPPIVERAARLAVTRGDPKRALALLTRRPPRDQALPIRIDALDALGRADEAEAFVVEQAETPPGPKLALAIAERAVKHKQFEQALALLKPIRGEGLAPGELAQVHVLRARSFEAKGDTREAIAEMTTATRISPGESIELELSALYERLGMLRDSLRILRGLSRSSPNPAPAVVAGIKRLEGAMTAEAPTVGEEGVAPPEGLPEGE